MKISVVGLAWFDNQSDYDAIRAVAGTKDMPSTYAEWVVLAERTEQREKKNGVKVVRATIKPDAFLTFCAREGLNVNSAARVRFANHSVSLLLNRG